ncbi:CBS domain-containing protein [Gloeothece verrucosa]|uniref:Polynucleotide adenylyltransferase region n=1 Tax=Gloeothece verrucosa (strain PCC 7822) TaxID=497965 RepID=E0U6W7_GLOV7|nr:CBS domain-containing protein [Gloeothece verrucosa]ADN16004.1 Polynucleotide adenylyltransferase region [Gloeothece verrucosa PCC 7822]
MLDLILCHQTADFDALGAAVGLSRLKIGSRIVLTGGAHPTVKDFLALHRDELALIEQRSVNPEQIRSLFVVDNQWRDRFGKAANWFDLPQLNAIEIYDHHLDGESDIPATEKYIEAIGATTTLIVERLQQQQLQLTPIEATVMALGIHVDTGSLTFDQTTPRDAYALAWLMTQGANVKIIAEYAEPGFTPQLQQLFSDALDRLNTTNVRGYKVAWILLTTENFIPGLSNLAERLLELSESDALLFGHAYSKGQKDDHSEKRLTLIGRCHIDEVNLNDLFAPFGGGGHSQAASVTFRSVEPAQMLDQLVEKLIETIPQPLSARDLMSSPVRTIRPDTTIEQAQRVLFRYGHSGLSVVDENDQLVGIISRRDIDLALHHGFSHAPVKGYMTRNPKTITPDTSLPEIEDLMVTYDLGRLPVVENGQLMGIVTRTDVLRQIHQDRLEKKERLTQKTPLISCLLPSFRHRLHPPIWKLLQTAAQQAHQRGWHLYLVGGAVRDLLLAPGEETLTLQDIDLVVDGFHRAADVGAGVELANQLQEIYPQVRLSVHGEFQTAALIWHKDAQLGSLMIDIATARTEFYPYPAANPQVEASSIRQDLYRRDFTINALAVRLTSPREGELLDFFGGVEDLRSQQIRVLHANSFIEDPTRIYRAVRFAVRLGFKIDPHTEDYIRYAICSGVYDRLRLENHPAPALTTRLRAELTYILEAAYWKPALQLLSNLGALRCLHSNLVLDANLWWQIRFVSRWLKCLDSENHFSHWLIRLEVLIAALKPDEREQIAANLQLPKDSIERLRDLEKIENSVQQNLKKCDKISEIFLLLRQYKVPSLIIVAARSDRLERHRIWQYLTKWSKIQTFLDGNDLKAMGYKPGPQFKQILDQLLIATLDGEIMNREESVEFVTNITEKTAQKL